MSTEIAIKEQKQPPRLRQLEIFFAVSFSHSFTTTNIVAPLGLDLGAWGLDDNLTKVQLILSVFLF